MEFGWMVKGLSGVALAFGVSVSAQAAAYCSAPGDHPDGLDVSNVTYEGSNADDCYGVVMGNLTDDPDANNPNNIGINNLGLTWGSDWTFAAKDQAEGPSGGTFLGLSFALSASTFDDNQGTWTLTVTDTNGGDPLNLPATLDFVAGLKGADRYALWFFDDVTVDTENDGTWEIVFAGPGQGDAPALSHMTLYVREGDDGGPPQETPAPGTLALVGLGLIGAGWIRRRRA